MVAGACPPRRPRLWRSPRAPGRAARGPRAAGGGQPPCHRAGGDLHGPRRLVDRDARAGDRAGDARSATPGSRWSTCGPPDADAAVAAAWAALPAGRAAAAAPVGHARGGQGRLAGPAHLPLPDLAQRAAHGDGRRQAPRATSGRSGSTTCSSRPAISGWAQVALILGRLLPRGYQRETFAGRRAQPLDGERLRRADRAASSAGAASWVCRAWPWGWSRMARWCSRAGSACASWAQPAPVDADTLFLIASNTKALTTLLLGTLVDRRAARPGTRRCTRCSRPSGSAMRTPPAGC